MEKISSLRISSRSKHTVTYCFDHAGANRWTNFQLTGARILGMLPHLREVEPFLLQQYHLPADTIMHVRIAVVKPPEQGVCTVCAFQIDNDFVHLVEPYLQRKLPSSASI